MQCAQKVIHLIPKILSFEFDLRKMFFFFFHSANHSFIQQFEQLLYSRLGTGKVLVILIVLVLAFLKLTIIRGQTLE